MVDKTLEDLITDIQKGLYQAAGVGVQIYSQDILISKITDAFIVFASDPEVRWERFAQSNTYTLNGTTGRTVVPVATLFPYYDFIERVYVADSENQLVKAPTTGNYLHTTGNKPLQIIQDATDVMRVIPITATGDITIIGHTYPTSFALADVVPFDYLALKHYVIWKYMTEDGSNPGAAELSRQEFENRYSQLKKMQMNAPIALNGRGGYDYPTEWY